MHFKVTIHRVARNYHRRSLSTARLLGYSHSNGATATRGSGARKCIADGLLLEVCVSLTYYNRTVSGRGRRLWREGEKRQ